MDGGACWPTAHGLSESDMTEQLTLVFLLRAKSLSVNPKEVYPG